MLVEMADNLNPRVTAVPVKAFQNTRADTKATLTAKPGGAFTCTFSIKWSWKPIGFDDDTLCDIE